ncbi:deoxyribodipyrimidine photo-lyase [Streptomyces sp. NPDC002156]
MHVSVALFTADLRVHDNPVLQAALRDAERVAPLFVVDTGIRRAGFAVPNHQWLPPSTTSGSRTH